MEENVKTALKIFVIVAFIIFCISAITAFDFGETSVNTNNIYIVNESQVVHNNLTGLQGGTTNQYYHITLAWFNELTADILNWITQSEGDVRYSLINEPLWTDNFTKYNSTWSSIINTSYITWSEATNGTLFLTSQWNATNTSYYLESNPYS